MRRNQMILSKLKKLRETHNKTLQDMAKVLGITKQGYWLIENGKRKLSYENAVKLSSLFDKKPDDIFLSSLLTNEEQTVDDEE